MTNKEKQDIIKYLLNKINWSKSDIDLASTIKNYERKK